MFGRIKLGGWCETPSTLQETLSCEGQCGHILNKGDLLVINVMGNYVCGRHSQLPRQYHLPFFLNRTSMSNLSKVQCTQQKTLHFSAFPEAGGNYVLQS